MNNRDWSAWLERLVCAAGENEERRRRKVQFMWVSILVAPAGVIWGALYFVFDERTAAIFPFGYPVLGALNFLVLLRLRRYEVYRQVTQLLILLLPVSLHAALGGFVGSSVVIVWSFLAVVLSVLFGDTREARFWFAAYGVALGIMAIVQPNLDSRNHLPAGFVLTLFVLNLGTVLFIAFLVLFSFLQDRRRLRELELAYLNQEMMLRHAEKMATLGTLAAGLTHELNNPAAATRRAAEQLRGALGTIDVLPQIEQKESSNDANALAFQLQERIRQYAANPLHLSPIARSTVEGEVEDWLDDRKIRISVDAAPMLVDMGLNGSILNGLFGAMDASAITSFLTPAAANYSLYSLVNEVHKGSSRISEIVDALKVYSYLDRAPVQPVKVQEGLDNTLLLLRSKLSAGIVVTREYDPNVPVIQGFGSELNQVWTSLILNAVQALEGHGEIAIRTTHDRDVIVVEIEDNGPGIPTEIQSRIFDPFFTTKEPGSGIGMGLSTTFAIVAEMHGGTIAVNSMPGRTKFTVRLPLTLPG